jgi:OmpR-family two-component system manganese-sensing sensor histidine kinase
MLSVSDTGVGIPPDQLPHVFERFYRGDPARSPGTTGSNGRSGAGLGLAIGSWIADAHGAVISVVSEVDKGTTVTVDFPPPATGFTATVHGPGA